MDKKFHNLFIRVRKLNDIFNDAIVVVDTNVLLMAYQWRDTTFETVYEILDELAKQERLKIPTQVIKEFANKRPQTIRDLSNDLHDKILSKLEKGKSDHHNLNKVIPGLEFFEDKEELINSEKKYNDAIQALKDAQKEYKESLNNHLNKIKEYIDNDPIVFRLESILKSSILDDIECNEEDLKKDAEVRKEKNIPPGYKDKGHLGDLKIWKEILSISNRDVIFITKDNKNDWVYKDNRENIIGARRELVEEFYALHNKTFKIISPLDFIKKYSTIQGLDVPEEVQEDIGKTNILSGTVGNLNFNNDHYPYFLDGDFEGDLENIEALEKFSQVVLKNLYEGRHYKYISHNEFKTLYEDYGIAKKLQNEHPKTSKSIYLQIFTLIDERMYESFNNDLESDV